MITCPLCGAKTAVGETRATGSGLRRRRHCTIESCTGRVTTVEIVIRAGCSLADIADGNGRFVSARQLQKLRKIVADIDGSQSEPPVLEDTEGAA